MLPFIWLLLSMRSRRSKFMFVAAPLSTDSGRFGSSIIFNISVSSSIRAGDINSISGVAVNNSSCLISVQAAILFEELVAWYDKSSTIV